MSATFEDEALNEGDLTNDVVRLFGLELQKLRKELAAEREKVKLAEQELGRIREATARPLDAEGAASSMELESEEREIAATAINRRLANAKETERDIDEHRRLLFEERERSFVAEREQMRVERDELLRALEEAQNREQALIAQHSEGRVVERKGAIRVPSAGAQTFDPREYIDNVEAASGYVPRQGVILAKDTSVISRHDIENANSQLIGKHAILCFGANDMEMQWSAKPAQNMHAYTLKPSWTCKSGGTGSNNYSWVKAKPDAPATTVEFFGPLRQSGGEQWVYFGTYKCFSSEQIAAKVYIGLSKEAKTCFLRRAFPSDSHPAARTMITNLYNQRALKPLCTIFVQTGFNEELATLLLDRLSEVHFGPSMKRRLGTPMLEEDTNKRLKMGE